MKLTYTIQVCNESRELFSLLNFLQKTIDDEDEVNVVVDTEHTTDKVECVLEHFKERINIFKRPFDTFRENAQFHIEKANGEYIFGIDADEMPQETLIRNIKSIIEQSDAEIIAIPRINIHPGSTREFIEKSNFSVNEVGWINWPDFQMRIYKKCDYIKWSDEVHTKLIGSDKVVAVQTDPRLALWHIKSIEKQESRWAVNGDFTTPKGNLYDMLM
jgi:hypothetical protein